MHTVTQNNDKFTRNNLFYCCETLIFTHPLVHEFLCGPKHMATPVGLVYFHKTYRLNIIMPLKLSTFTRYWDLYGPKHVYFIKVEGVSTFT